MGLQSGQNGNIDNGVGNLAVFEKLLKTRLIGTVVKVSFDMDSVDFKIDVETGTGFFIQLMNKSHRVFSTGNSDEYSIAIFDHFVSQYGLINFFIDQFFYIFHEGDNSTICD